MQKAAHLFISSIATKYIESSLIIESFQRISRSCISLTEILDDFKILNEIPKPIDEMLENCNRNKVYTNIQTNNLDLKKCHQQKKITNLKFHDSLSQENRFHSYSRCYTLQEIRENGLQLVRRKEKLQCNNQNTNIILSEFIL